MNGIQKKRVLPENQFFLELLFNYKIKDFMDNDITNLATFNTCIIKVWHNSWSMVHYVLIYLLCTSMHTRIVSFNSRHRSLSISIFPYIYFHCTDVGLIHDDSLLNSYPSVALAIRSRACLNASNTFCTVL